MGIDISKRKCDVCVVDAKGKVLERGQYPNTPAGAKKHAAMLKRRYRSLVAACETTANMWQVTYGALEDAGIDVRLADTYKMVLISRTSKKTDKVDAEKIAQVLRMGMLPECHVPRAGKRAQRQLVRRRISLGQDRTREANRLHALLDMHGRKVDASRLHLKKAIVQLEGMALGDGSDSVDTAVLRSHVAQIEYLNGAIADVERRIDSEAAADEDALLLMSITGFDSYSAIAMSAEIDGVGRFPTVKQFVSWTGMCPVVRQSGDEIHHGGVKKTGRSRSVNWLLAEAANTAVQHDPRMRAVYEAAKARHGGKHGPAIVVVANKMATIMYYVLKSRKAYTHHNAERYSRKLSRLRSRAKRNGGA